MHVLCIHAVYAQTNAGEGYFFKGHKAGLYISQFERDIVAPVNFVFLAMFVLFFQQDPLPNASLLVERLARACGGCGYAGINLRPGVYFYSTNESPFETCVYSKEGSV